MSKPATPLDNQAAIAQMGQELRDSMRFMLGEFVRPTMLQTQANAETIDRISAICESNARAIAAEGERVRKLRESLEITRNVADDTADESSDHSSRIEANESRFEILLVEARAERAEWQAKFDVAMSELQEIKQQAEQRLSEQKAESDRKFSEQKAESDRKFSEQKAESDHKFSEQKAESDRRFDEQIAEIRALGEQNRALLSALATNNRRIDDLEQTG